MAELYDTGRRALLEMPSALDFPKTPVMQDSSRSFIICNTGNREARFAINCQAPFTASPTEALLDVGASMRCKMAFKPQTAGMSTGKPGIVACNQYCFVQKSGTQA